MAILRVAQMGHPVLRRVAEPVDPALIETPGFQRFLDDLLETMIDHDGAGLAAPQVHESVRVAVLILSEERGPEFFINPELTLLTDETIRFHEGCLSVEGLRAAVDRCSHVRIRALGRHGQPKSFELKGFPAVVVQHEFDHLDGILFVDRCDTTTLAFLSEFRRYGPLDELEFEDLPHDETSEVGGPDDTDEISAVVEHSPLDGRMN